MIRNKLLKFSHPLLLIPYVGVDKEHLCLFLFVFVCRYVFFLDPCNIDIVQRKIKSMALCVSVCPDEELKTYQDLKRFAMHNGE